MSKILETIIIRNWALSNKKNDNENKIYWAKSADSKYTGVIGKFTKKGATEPNKFHQVILNHADGGELSMDTRLVTLNEIAPKEGVTVNEDGWRVGKGEGKQHRFFRGSLPIKGSNNTRMVYKGNLFRDDSTLKLEVAIEEFTPIEEPTGTSVDASVESQEETPIPL